jgi:acyl-CoA synthetase (AMP-forming)/AMP-acid ligase II
LFGAAWAGIPYVPLNYRLPADDLLALAHRVGSAIAVADETNQHRLNALDGFEAFTAADFTSETHLLNEPDLPEWPTDPEQVAVLLFTSGTTGSPKSAVLRHKHLVSYILGSVEFMGAADDEATLVSVPPYHVAGVAAMLSSVYAGRRIVQLPRFDADTWIDTVEQEGITHAMVVPTMLTRIVDALDARGGEPMLGLRALSYGGGKMPRPVIERALELFPITNFVNAYGLTETSSTIALLGPDDHRIAQYSDDPLEQQRLSSVGRPLPGLEVAVRDDHGNDLGPGQVGEIFVRGEQVAGEYQEQGSLLDADGWFPTRDGGFVDEAGYLFIQGRNDDVIIRGGENMSPGEIEDVVLTHPGIRDAAAIGVPCREWGEKVVLVLVAGPQRPESDEISELIRSRLRSSRVPSHIEFCEELPYNETGKLLRRVLRERYAALGDTPTE